MQRYKTIKALGDGTYGSVFKAVNRATGDIVAIKVTTGPTQLLRLIQTSAGARPNPERPAGTARRK
jgi:serine/threonine protein kinase